MIKFVLQARHVKGLSNPQQLLLIALADYADASGKCWPSVPRLAREINHSERQTQRLLRQLTEKGLLFATMRPPQTSQYYINLAALAEPETVTPMSPDGDTHVTLTVTPMSPDPVIDPVTDPVTREEDSNGNANPPNQLIAPTCTAIQSAIAARCPHVSFTVRVPSLYDKQVDLRTLPGFDAIYASNTLIGFIEQVYVACNYHLSRQSPFVLSIPGPPQWPALFLVAKVIRTLQVPRAVNWLESFQEVLPEGAPLASVLYHVADHPTEFIDAMKSSLEVIG